VPSLWLLYLVSFLMGAIETLADAAYGALVADTVPAGLLGRANARVQLTFTVNNLLVGPPLGALLFAAGAALPFGLHVIACAVAAYGRLEKRVGQTALLRAGLVVEALTYLALALTTNPWVAGATMAVFGVHAIVWGAVAVTARQRATPTELLGRVGSVYQLASVTGTVLGSLSGGAAAAHLGLLVPFWGAFGLVAVLAVATWRRLAAVSTGVRARETVEQ
jgi:predicted MFS family arabinose efflux permease